MKENNNIPPNDQAILSNENMETLLDEKVGIRVDYNALNVKNLIKSILFSGIGVFVFFIPITIGETSAVPMVQLINAIKGSLSHYLKWIVLFVCCALSVTYTIAKIQKKGILAKFHEKDGWISGILYYLSAIFAFLLVFQVGPAEILNEDVGGLAISLAGSTLLTITVAGWLVTFLIEFGILEFLGTLLEPIMRTVFKVPGQSAVDALSSFVAAPAVGVFITNKLYNENVYTKKEACCIATNFSVVSLGFFALLVTLTDTVDMYSIVVLSSLIISFILAAIVIRIPPLSRKENRYRNGMEQTPEMRRPGKYTLGVFKKAVAAATTKAASTEYSVFVEALKGVVSFALKIVVYVQALAVLALLISTYTPFFTWIGKPMIPLLNLLGLPNADIIAPATLLGIAEIALPAISIAGQNVAPMSIFFILVLSTVQIIFFTESANAMLQADMGLKFGELILIFFIRTLVAIPIVAVAAHLLF